MALLLSILCFWGLYKLAMEWRPEGTEVETDDVPVDEPDQMDREWAKIRKLDRNIKSQKEIVGNYYAQLDWLQLQQSGTVPGGKEFTKWQNKIVAKTTQIRRAEDKLADLEDARTMISASN